MRNGKSKASLADILRGTIRGEIQAAFPEAVINACSKHGIPLRNVVRADACTLQIEVYEKDWENLKRLIEPLQAEVKALDRRGGSRERAWFARRSALFFSLLCVGTMLLWFELRIWEIDVHGCEKVTRGQVLRALEVSGVSIGSYWPSISSDSIRGKMLLQLPELAWMTVNVSGSRALVYVVERKEKPEIYSESRAADVRAARSGILQELTVLNGRPLVGKGSAVAEGDVLVSGAMESLSHPARHVRAAARVMAETWYEWTAVEPEGQARENDPKRIRDCLAVQFGKTRIKLFGRSRKDLDGYDKIVHEYRMGIKGLFAFPVTLIREEYRGGGWSAMRTLSAAERLQGKLAGQVEGEILQLRFSTARSEDCLYTTLRAHCLENIAQTAELDLP